jgi:hypothetical protein
MIVLGAAWLVAAGLPGAAAAQTGLIAGGIAGGIQSATLTSEFGGTPFESGSGPVGGVFIVSTLGGRYEVIAEGLVNQRRLAFTAPNGTAQAFSMWSVQIPVMLRFNLARTEGAAVFVAAGAGADMRLRYTLEDVPELDLHEVTERTTAQLYFGAGILLGPVSVEVRHARGVNSITATQNVILRTDAETRSTALLVGYRLWK